MKGLTRQVISLIEPGSYFDLGRERQQRDRLFVRGCLSVGRPLVWEGGFGNLASGMPPPARRAEMAAPRRVLRVDHDVGTTSLGIELLGHA